MGAERAKALLHRLFKGEKANVFLAVLGLCGVLLLVLPSLLPDSSSARASPEQEESVVSAAEYARALEDRLSGTVRAITGESDPSVLITLESEPRLVLAADEKLTARDDSQDRDSRYLVLKDQGGAQHAVPLTQVEPQVRGVVIVSTRAAEPLIRERLIQAASTALGLSSARVFVTQAG